MDKPMPETLRTSPIRDAILRLLKKKNSWQYQLWKDMNEGLEKEKRIKSDKNLSQHIKVLIQYGLVERYAETQGGGTINCKMLRLVGKK